MIYNPHNYFVIRTSERTPLPSLSWNQTFNMYIYMLLLCFLSQIHPHTAVKHTSSVPRTETEALDQQAQRYDTTTEPAAWSCSHSPRVSVLPTRSLSSHTGWPLSLSMRHHPSSSHWETSTHTQREGGERFSSFLHLQRMTVHDSGVFQRLKTWPSGMHHSISTQCRLRWV